MAMSYAQRMRYIQEEANKFVARNKVRDSSELTLIRQAKASSVELPQTVSAVINQHTSLQMTPYPYESDCPTNVVFTGVGTSNDYTAKLQKAQSCAVCADDNPVNNQYITLPTPCFDRTQFPFIQTNLSTPVICKDPGFNQFFPPGPPCAASTNIYYLPSA
jgi:hypothetical protein